MTIDVPSIVQTFSSSKDSPNVDASKPFPAFWQPAVAGDPPSSSRYPALPDSYPLGGYIDTVADNIRSSSDRRAGFPSPSRWAAASPPVCATWVHRQPRTAPVRRESTHRRGSFCDATGTCRLWDRQAPASHPGEPSGVQGPVERREVKSYEFPKDDPTVGGNKAINFDFGDFNDPQKGFYKGPLLDVGRQLRRAPRQLGRPGYKSYALAKMKVDDFGKQVKLDRVVNLSRTGGGQTLPPDYTYAEGGAAVDPTDETTSSSPTNNARSRAAASFSLVRSMVATHGPTRSSDGLIRVMRIHRWT